ncbi:dihydrodipicolinate synthase family protein [Ornithinimicrobium cavernae]|uniref:dihydrodipicolinate synthase family protein n=1 Tax=Ornithinimicrobium cavernae TaxID=2666047 RepID=UPI000D69234C|nr:dihydrodipicolinate synthase family protein [Ornithinimicrobium cavernae]
MVSSGTIRIPRADGGLHDIQLQPAREWAQHPQGFRSRVAFAAAHVVADPLRENGPGQPAAIDWDSTLGFRQHLFDHGLGVAEAMDTAQRNMGLDWPAVQELVTRSAAQARAAGARIASGAGTDHVGECADLAAVTRAYAEQVAFVEGAGSQVIVMASRHLARLANDAEDYLTVYDEILRQVSEPVILHWLGTMFDPQLEGYWGSDDIDTATATFLELVHRHADRVDGVKVSLLSAEHEVGLRAALPEGVRLYTGDDYNYPELIRGDGSRHSDALLGAFAAIAPAASAALAALDEGDLAAYEREMTPTLPLSRLVFAPPTWFYKTGIAFLSWLCGHQPGFTMVGGLQSARSVPHLAEVFALANAARLFPDPDLAAHRLGLWLASQGAPA